MIGRVVPPAASPLAFGTVVAGLGAALAGRRHEPRAADALRRHLQGADVRLVRSGTAALTLALESAGEAARARGIAEPWVALPAYGCYDLATAAIGARLRVRLYDLDPRTLAPDLVSLRAVAALPGCAAVVLVHLYGVPVDVPAIRRVLDGTGVVLVEDAAQGAGGRLHGAPLGTHGDFGVLSFGRGKGIIAGGGGALVTRGRPLPTVAAPVTRGLRAAVLTAAQWLLGRPSLYGIPAALPFLGLGETRYRPPEPTAGMPAACAAMLPAALHAAEAAAVRRGEVAATLRAAAERAGLQPIDVPADGDPGWLRCPVLVPGGVAPERLAVGRALGVMPAYPTTLAALPELVSQRDDLSAGFPGADRIVAELVTLPCHHLLARHDLQRLAVWLHDSGLRPTDAPTHRL